MPTFQIALDQHPSVRYTQVINHFEDELLNTIEQINSVVPWYFKAIFWCIDAIKGLTTEKNSLTQITDEMYLEFVGVAERLHLPTYKIMIANYIYEFFASCTSIVSHYDDDNKIMHARNLDYRFAGLLKNMVYNAEFTKNGEIVYRAVMFAGYSGTLTAMTPHKFAISINSRHRHDFFGKIYNLIRYISNAESPAFALRRISAEAQNFTHAKEMLENAPLVAPVYFIISGVSENEGAIITRDRSRYQDTLLINSQSPVEWNIVQTNYDHWISPAPEGDINRRRSAKMGMESLGKHSVTHENILTKVLQVSPVFNENTIYSTVMNANLDFFETTLYN